MRGLPVLVGALIAMALLAGCSQAPPGGGPATPPADDPSRTARGTPASDEAGGDEPELEPVQLLRAPLTMAGPGPESFDLTVPEGITAVQFEFSGGSAFTESGLHVELSGCGAYDGGLSTSTSGGGAYYSQKLCGGAAAGPAKVTISATLVVFDGTFILTGFTPAANATSAPSNATASR
jgi:hypothetical protein